MGSKATDSGVKHLSSLLEDPNCKLERLELAGCKLTEKSCEHVASVLQSPNSLIELDLKDNELTDSGVQLLSKGLSSPHCKLQTLRLCKCGFSSEGYVCLALALMLNPSCVKELDVSNNHPGESTQKLLSATLKDPHRKVEALQLAGCKLTDKSCELVASVLQSPNSLLELDLKNNNLGDSGVQLLSKGLSSPQCRLQALSLQNCSIGEEGFTALASALRSNPSHMRKLWLMGSKATDSGVKHLSSLLEDPNCKLEFLDLQNCNIGEEGFTALASALRSNPSHMRELWLKGSKATDSGVKHLSSFLEDPNCKLEILGLNNCSIGEEGFTALASALRSNPSHMRKLLLRESKATDSGVKHLSSLLEDPNCKLENLDLNNCSIGEEGFTTLASALRSNPSHMRELRLEGNKATDSGVKHLSSLLEDPNCKLKILNLNSCSIGVEGFTALASALRSNPSHMRELFLRGSKATDSGVKHLSSLLEDPNCKLEKLDLTNCSIGEEGFTALASALRSNPSHMRELWLGGSKATDSGVKHLSSLLEDPNCKLEELDLQNCSIGEEGFTALVSALKSNPSHVRKLWLMGSKATDSGVKHLSSLLEDPNCKLETLDLVNSSIVEEGFTALASALRSNPSHMRELYLEGSKSTDSGVKHLSSLLEDPNCKLEKLDLESCSITDEGFRMLASALRSTPSALRDLWLGRNQPGPSAQQLLSELKKHPNCKHIQIHGVDEVFNPELPSVSRGSEVIREDSSENTVLDQEDLDSVDNPDRRTDVRGLSGDMAELDISAGETQCMYDRRPNCCKSCEDVEDTSHWILMEPSVSMETGVPVYKHSSPPGSFECTVSGLRWVCAVEVSLRYHLSDPHVYRAELAMLQYEPIGPLMDIKVLSGELLEAHLPHFACLEGSDSSLREAVRVLHGVNSSVTLEKCELTRFHAKLLKPSFSLTEVLMKFGIKIKAHLEVLTYRTRVTPLVLFTYVVPRDASMIQAVEEDVRDAPNAKKIKTHRPNIPIQMNTELSLNAYPTDAEISPSEITLKYMRPPEFFKVVIGDLGNLQSFYLEIRREGESVWNAKLNSFEYGETGEMAHSREIPSAASSHSREVIHRETSSTSRVAGGDEEYAEGPRSHGIPSGASRRDTLMAAMSNYDRLSMIRSDLINNTSGPLLRGLLDKLQAPQYDVISKREAEYVLERTNVLQDQVTSLIDMVLKKRDKACGVMLSLLKELDSYLSEDLGL
ncbi:uncharacterized protein LOC134082698 [Sardina pilchardus]|uniref:uncharacterized protein LOC134082698 n=1 Tax=Sardina pilchardus TaxID=27697 RepID=UPI002E0FA5F6